MKKFLLITILVLSIAACKREDREFRVRTPETDRIQSKALVPIMAGGSPQPAHVRNDYENNAYAMSEGKRLFSSFNCYGCHGGSGGGGMGPPLIDDVWIYGNAPEQIFSSIVEGRPNGMPSFRNKLPNYQVWQLAAYVRSMSGLAAADAAPGRNDDMQSAPPENTRPAQIPGKASLNGTQKSQ
jgi:cytochrome c oxidase cbb3-type subunit III